MSALASPKADPTVILGVRGSRVGLRGRASVPPPSSGGGSSVVPIPDTGDPGSPPSRVAAP